MKLSKVRTAEEIIARFKDGQIIAIGGQTNQYMPDRLIDCVLESGARHLTIYSIDSSDPGHGVSLLVEAGRVDAMITTHVGTNPLTNAKIQSGALKAEFNPMGTFIERIRCGGAGLGGVLTKTGLGTVVEEGECALEVKQASGQGRYDQIVEMIQRSEQMKSAAEAKASGLADKLVPYTFANNAARINAGLEIIGALSAHWGLTMPVFIDNAESITHIASLPSQVVRLVVSEADSRLRLEVDAAETEGAA